MSVGSRDAHPSLSPATYAELKRAAAGILRGAAGRPVNVTSLAHDAYGRLARRRRDSWKSQSHFLAAASQAMRHILVDAARRQNAQRRGGGVRPQTISIAELAHDPRTVDVLALDETLTRLAALDERQARIVEMKVFAGLTNPEIATALGVSKSTVEADWRHARAWLRAELASPDGAGA